MLTSFKRGWLLFAVSMGLIFQFFQFFRSQAVVITAMTDSFQAADGSAPVMNAQQQGMANSVPRYSEATRRVDVQQALENSNVQNDDKNPQDPNVEGGPPLPPLVEFDPAKFNYSQPAIPTEYTLPAPKRTNQSTIVICLSARANFERRAAIRDTWAKGNDNVYFVIGGPIPGDTEDMDKEDPLSISSLLFREQQLFGDMIDVIHPDAYKSLPYKLHFAMRWVMTNINNVEWIVKSDDDTVVRPKLLEFFVLRQMNPYHPQVIGTIAVGSRPHRQGKWEEDPKYTADEYPPWAFGSAGYVVSHPVAQYVADHDLYYYQGEDAGLGIWLAQSPLQVTWVDSPELRKDEGCDDKLYIIGHDLSIDAMRNCFAQVGDTVPDRSHIVAFSAGRKDQFPNRISNPN